MKRWAACLPIVAIILLVFTHSVQVRGAPSAVEPFATACLSNDPYDLDQLAAVINSTTPPSAPVTINANLIVQFVRSASMGDDSGDDMARGTTPTGPRQPGEPPLSAAAFDEVPMRVFNTRTQFEYRVTMSDAMLRAIYDCHARTGRTESGGPDTPGAVEGQAISYLPLTIRSAAQIASARQLTPRADEPDGWSDGDDSRIVRTPTTLWPWRAITQSSSWPNGNDSRCTMTLIGPRHLVTAAHCLVNFGSSSWKSRKLTPARDGITVSPYGSSQMTPNPPAGQDAWYIVPDPWLDPATPDTIDKYQWDIGLVLMLDRLGDQTGWMGYGAYPASDLNQRNHLNRGYPSCRSDYVEKPEGAGCQTARLYGDTRSCEIGDYHNPGSNGWNREYTVNCDISRGHSGSAIYHYRYNTAKGTYIPVVTGVVSWHECLTCTAADDYPNHIRRITPWVLGRVSWLKEQFP